MKITGTLFLATLFCVTWEKVQWNVAGAVGIADVLTVMFLVAFALEWGRPRFPRTTVTVLAIFAALLVIYLIGFFNIETKQSLDQWGKGMVKFVLHFLFLGAGVAYLVAALDALLLEGRRRIDRRARRERRLRRPAAARGTRRDEPRPCPALAADRRSELDQRVRRDRRHRRLQAECAHDRSEPSRRDDLHPAADPAARVPEARARAQDARAARGRARLPLPRHALDAFAQRAARAARRPARACDSVPPSARVTCARRAADRESQRSSSQSCGAAAITSRCC